jgi:NAD(P)-dependent dehydrogenase (short-subunit alcohol dehydrogenase family)
MKMNEAGTLAGQTALITGGAKRIGREIALVLAKAGADVAITYNASERAACETVDEVASLGVRGFAIHCDVRSEASVKSAIGQARRALRRLDILINNAAIYETVEFQQLTAARWDNMFATNTRGPFLAAKHAASELRRREGRIINIGSLGGLRPWTTHAHYCASKAALHSLTQAMAKAYAPEIAVNCIAPGMIEAEDEAGTAHARRFAAKTPMQRNGTAADVAAMVRLLAIAPSFVTGQIIAVDGGLSLA